MTLEEIKSGVKAGKTVHWKNDGYTVVSDRHDQWFIVYLGWRDYVGLTHKITGQLIESESEFYIGE